MAANQTNPISKKTLQHPPISTNGSITNIVLVIDYEENRSKAAKDQMEQPYSIFDATRSKNSNNPTASDATNKKPLPTKKITNQRSNPGTPPRRQQSSQKNASHQSNNSLSSQPSLTTQLTRGSPTTTDDFLQNSDLMNLSEHLDPTLDTSNTPHQQEENINPSKPNKENNTPRINNNREEQESPLTFLTLEERRQKIERSAEIKQITNSNKTNTHLRFVSTKVDQKKEKTRAEKDNTQPKKRNEPDRSSAPKYLPKSSRRNRERSNSQKQNAVYSTQQQNSKTNTQYNSNHSERQTEKWILKVEQTKDNRDEVTLNRRGVLTLIHLVPKLSQITSDDLRIVEPSHYHRRATCYLHIISRRIKNKLLDRERDFRSLGYHLSLQQSNYENPNSKHTIPSAKKSRNSENAYDPRPKHNINGSAHERRPSYRNTTTTTQQNSDKLPPTQPQPPSQTARTPSISDAATKDNQKAKIAFRKERHDQHKNLTKTIHLPQNLPSTPKTKNSTSSSFWAWLPKALATHRSK
ncbi:uncharacterized protein [Ambystoma mexicanum]|uniref:uncharacterized protein n=1 Tax=Ambystoma mexicanum TaxID=8296 RepID=UPI0037E987AC